MEITKDMVGQTIYGIPTGNNARRGVKMQEPEAFVVVKVKRKYVDLQKERGGFIEAYCPKTGATQDSINSGLGRNAGYRFFHSLEMIGEWRELQKKIEAIGDYFGYYGGWKREITPMQVARIYGILFDEDE